MFFNFYCLECFPDITKWDIKNITIKENNTFKGINLKLFSEKMEIKFKEFFEEKMDEKDKNDKNFQNNKYNMSNDDVGEQIKKRIKDDKNIYSHLLNDLEI